MIAPIGNLHCDRVRTTLTIEIDRSNRVACFVRYTPRGLVLVRCFEDAETLVQAIIGGTEWSRWYRHGVTTARSAALLVNRFFRDIDAAQEAQP